MQQLKLGHGAPQAARVELDEALKNGWIEFWYQPKIDLRKKQLAGVEAFARCRHPQIGILLPGAFMPGATEAELTSLSELAIASVLKAGARFAKLGVNMRFAVNIPVSALVKLSIPDLVRAHRDAGRSMGRADHRRHRGADRHRPRAGQRDDQEARACERQARDRRFRPRLFVARSPQGAAVRRAQARPRPSSPTAAPTRSMRRCARPSSISRTISAASRSRSASRRPPMRWRSPAWAATSARASCWASRCRRSASSRCCASAPPAKAARCRRRPTADPRYAPHDVRSISWDQWVQASRRLKAKLSA